eukprot:TRINITY_DN67129_c7_g4_i1.p1 TRINITY_DN67129_c7_g4~~TRINITY_DN67129_c7_g4_i1.p1  ORF type:complete len:450 (+),score=19.15 TRINITY_DN67129_c7_g4_i1:46-1395(+)
MDQRDFNDAAVYFLCCELAYSASDADFNKESEELKRHELEYIHDWHDSNELQYVVVKRAAPDELIIAFRGMIDSFDFQDLSPFSREDSLVLKNRKAMLCQTNLVELNQPITCDGGRCHEGMVKYFQRVQKDLTDFMFGVNTGKRWIDELKKCTVVTTGFSMGCSLATLAGLLVKKHAQDCDIAANVKQCSFAAPKLGDVQFCDHVQKSFKSVHSYYLKRDPVASFPDTEGYAMAGDVIVLFPNEEKVHFDHETPKWMTEWHPYSHTNTSKLVTEEQMKLGTLTVQHKLGLPNLDILRNCGKFHRLLGVKEAFDTMPLPANDTIQALRQHQERKAKGIKDNTSFFPSFIPTCLSKSDAPDAIGYQRTVPPPSSKPKNRRVMQVPDATPTIEDTTSVVSRESSIQDGNSEHPESNETDSDRFTVTMEEEEGNETPSTVARPRPQRVPCCVY